MPITALSCVCLHPFLRADGKTNAAPWLSLLLQQPGCPLSGSQTEVWCPLRTRALWQGTAMCFPATCGSENRCHPVRQHIPKDSAVITVQGMAICCSTVLSASSSAQLPPCHTPGPTLQEDAAQIASFTKHPAPGARGEWAGAVGSTEPSAHTQPGWQCASTLPQTQSSLGPLMSLRLVEVH